MVLLLVFLPFLSFTVCCLFGGSRLIKERGIQAFICIVWGFLWVLTLFMFIILGNAGVNLEITLACWVHLFPVEINWAIHLNKVTLTMLLLIFTVSALVHVYSLSYMSGEPHLSLFMGYLSLFTFFMVILVTSTSLLQLFIGWEGVGVCSYLLINFWSTRLLASQSAYKAMAINKVGDMALLISMGILYKVFGSIQLNVINISASYYLENQLVLLAIILLFIGVVGKSAQVGLHMWLPDAMEGPTPVSALIHAATMVTAGVFLIIKLSPLFSLFNVVSFIIVIVGSVTCLVAAAIGCAQSDLKKIIAYSTCSQLGYMVMVGGYGYYSVSLLHLFNHGIFKALLFLSAGLVIHSLFNEQNSSKMGLYGVSPLAKYGFFIGNLAIMGFPFFTGFYSKDLFLELLAARHSFLIPLLLGYLAASITCFYSFKLFCRAYLSEKRYPAIFKGSFHLSSPFILVPLLALGLGSIVLGYAFFNELTLPVKPIMINTLVKLYPLIILVVVMLLCFRVSYTSVFVSYVSSLVFSLIRCWINAFWFNELVSKFMNKGSIVPFSYTYKLIDSQLLEWLSTSTLSKAIKRLASSTGIFTSSMITAIIRSLCIGIVLILFFI